MRAKLFDDRKKIAHELKKQGLKNVEISKKINITTRTLRNWFK